MMFLQRPTGVALTLAEAQVDIRKPRVLKMLQQDIAVPADQIAGRGSFSDKPGFEAMVADFKRDIDPAELWRIQLNLNPAGPGLRRHC